MAPSNTYVTDQLRRQIRSMLQNDLFQNALSLSERLLAYDHKSAESQYLLAQSHFRLGDHRSAYDAAKSNGLRGLHLGCAYVFAQVALVLEKHKEGIHALEKARELWTGRNSFGRQILAVRDTFPDAAAVNCMLGKLYLGFSDNKKAVSYFEEALRLNPFMWDAFTYLCDMGANVRVQNIFKITPEMEAYLKVNLQTENLSSSQHGSISGQGQSGGLFMDPVSRRPPSRPATSLSNNADPFSNAPSKSSGGGLFGYLRDDSSLNISHAPASSAGSINIDTMETPTGPGAAAEVKPGLLYPPAPGPRTRKQPLNLAQAASKISRGVPLLVSKRTHSGQPVPHSQVDDIMGAPRRSERLNTRETREMREIRETREMKRPPTSRSTRTAANSVTSSTTGRTSTIGTRRTATGDNESAVSTRRTLHSNNAPGAAERQAENEMAKQEEALKTIMDLLKKCGMGYLANSRFECDEALKIFESLPRSQQETPWVLSQMGKAHFETASYAKAELYYRKIRSMAPARNEDMEIYSTILWHLKKETELSFLAHEMVDQDWHSPQAWCALGNAWSLAREHEQALRCFHRATQLNPKFAYAFTLQGHEHVANEEYNKALGAYRKAITADKRHYNAYYGIGRVYEKQGDFEKAFTHFNAASTISPTNAVLICCMGTVLEKQKNPRQAFTYFSRATDLAPRNALMRFKKARALMATGDMDRALKELMILKDLAPDEAMVHFLLGRLYKSLHQKSLAVRHFTIALNLDPKVCISANLRR